MSPTCCSCAPVRPAADINAAIRELSAGRTAWRPEDLAALARLRAEWQAAVERETSSRRRAKRRSPRRGGGP